MLRRWPFFQSLLTNLRMVLAKVDLSIAERYVELMADRDCAQRLYAAIGAEYARTCEAVQWLGRQEPQRLPTNASLNSRLVYLNPLNQLQVELLRGIREPDRDPEEQRPLRIGVHLSINGIASGLRNSG